MLGLSSCVAQKIVADEVPPKVIGKWQLVGVNDGPPNRRYPACVYAINADKTCSQSIEGKERKGTWRWEEHENALVLTFDQGSMRAVYIHEVNKKEMTWQRVNDEPMVHFTRVVD